MEKSLSLQKLVNVDVISKDTHLYFKWKGVKHAIGIEKIENCYFFVSEGFIELKSPSPRQLMLSILRKVDPKASGKLTGLNCSNLWVVSDSGGDDVCLRMLKRNYIDAKTKYVLCESGQRLLNRLENLPSFPLPIVVIIW
jgi:hypothetical protein